MYRARKTLWVIRWRRWSEDIFGVEEVGREGGEDDEEDDDDGAGEGSGSVCDCV